MFNLQTTRQTRQAQLFREIHKTWESYEFTKILQELFYDWSWSDFEDYMKKYGFNNLEARAKQTMVCGYFEGVAIMAKKGLIDLDLLYDFENNTIIGFWEKYRVIIDGWRRMFSSPQMYESIDWLYGEMKRMQALKGHGFVRPVEKTKVQ